MINAGLCANFEQDGCMTAPGQVPCPSGPTPVCSAGQCTRLDALSCDERITEAQLEVLNAAMASADHECMTDADCVH